MLLRNIKKRLLRNRTLFQTLGILSFLPLFYILLYKLYIPRLNAFGCFDDCNNFIGGWYLLSGKQIFSEFFFNHMPMAAYVSALIQAATEPNSIYELVLRHRQFMILFGFLFSILLVLRFRLSAFIFIILYELSKFYFFGDRFLSEGMIVYPIIYLTAALFQKINNEKLLRIDYILAPIFTWFIIFSREPYIPLAIFLFTLILIQKKFTKKIVLSFTIFASLSFLTLFSSNIYEFYYNVVEVNVKAVLPAESAAHLPGPKILQSFLYPLYIPFFGPFNGVKILLIGVTVVFLVNFARLISQRKYKLAIIIFITLGLSNIRVVTPGELFYSAFHMLIFWAVFIFTTLYLFRILKNKILIFSASGILFLSFALFIFSPSYFAYEKVDPHTEHITNYGKYIQYGEILKLLANENDTLFIDGYDDMVYYQSKIPSPYLYTWYTSAMVYFSKYTDARLTMFQKNPPDFYYGSCRDTETHTNLPDFIKNDYHRLDIDGKPSCLRVHISKLNETTPEIWEEAKKRFFTLPSE